MITLRIKNAKTLQGEYIEIIFPSDEKTLMDQLARININDSNISDCFVEQVHGEIPSLQVLENQTVNADEVNYLARRIDSLDRYEILKFQGAIARNNISIMRNLINLTFNLHNYTVVNEFSDLEKIGTRHYLDKNFLLIEKEDKILDFKQIGMDLLANPNGKITPFGIVYNNGLPMVSIYDGKTFPDYDYTDDYVLKVELELKEPTESIHKEYLYLPASKAAISKALFRLDARSYNDCSYQCVNARLFSENMLQILSATDNIGEINELCKILEPLDQDGISKLEAVLDFTQSKDLESIICNTKDLDDFKFVPGIKTAVEYGRHMIKESNVFKYDHNLEEFYDYGKYGKNMISNENGAFTSFGYVSCFTGEAQHLVIADTTLRTVRYYCPLLVQMELGRYEECRDGSDWLEPCDGVRYLLEIQAAIDLDCFRTMYEQGLMEYFTDNENISLKVQSAFPGVQIFDGEIYGVMVTKQQDYLTVKEKEQFLSFCSGQNSDGWGEGFEQHPIKTPDGEIYVSFWQSGADYFLLSEEDFKSTLPQKQSAWNQNCEQGQKLEMQ